MTLYKLALCRFVNLHCVACMGFDYAVLPVLKLDLLLAVVLTLIGVYTLTDALVFHRKDSGRYYS